MAVAWSGRPENQSPVASDGKVYLRGREVFLGGVTVSVVEANGQGCALVSRDGAVVALVTVGASEEGIDQIMWILRPSKLAGVLPPLA
jgi:hypothetical protein